MRPGPEVFLVFKSQWDHHFYIHKKELIVMCFNYDAVDIAIDNLVRKLSPKAIILFGSASNGTAGDDSDIDLLVVMETDLNKSDRFVLARGAVGRIGTPVDVLVYTPEEFQSESVRKGSFVREVIDTGRVVYGTA